MPYITTTLSDNVATLTLNNPKKHNALSTALINDLIGALQDVACDQCRVVILRAAPGVKVWSAGHDITELEASGHDPQSYNDPLRRVVRAIEEHPIPVIALIEGGVWGGACELAMSCDVLVATPDASFAITPAKLGVAYSIDGTLNFMKTVGLPLLREMLYTAAPVAAERAHRFGMINHVIEADKIEAFVVQLAQNIARNSPRCVSLLKEETRVLSEAHPLTAGVYDHLQGLRETLYNSEDYREGIRAFFEKRPANFTGR